jgi:hypothetical protein
MAASETRPDAIRSNRVAPPSHVRPRLRRWDAALRAVHEHVPRELRVSVNGRQIGACRVSGAECAFTLAVHLDEPIERIEVLSERSVRLMQWDIEPAGGVDQAARVDFDGGRWMSAAVRFTRDWPALEIAYRDPEWATRRGTDPARVLPFTPRAANPPTPSIWERLRARLARPRR